MKENVYKTPTRTLIHTDEYHLEGALMTCSVIASIHCTEHRGPKAGALR
jgi:hypothetical protein